MKRRNKTDGTTQSSAICIGSHSVNKGTQVSVKFWSDMPVCHKVSSDKEGALGIC